MTAKLRLPAGIYRNGTDYMAAGRYVDGNLIRWHNDVIRPVGGWQARLDFENDVDMDPLWDDGTATEAARSSIVIGNPTIGVDLYIGTNKHIFHISNSNLVTDVSPTFAAQPKHAVVDTGFGLYRFGYGKFGTPRPVPQGRVSNVFSWGFSAWGFWPIACARGLAGAHLKIKKDTDSTFVVIADSPVGTLDALVTDERFVMAFGDDEDFRSVRWSDREDYDEWEPTITNQAGDYRLVGTGKIVRGIKVLNQILILCDNDAHSGVYVGPPYVYGFHRVGDQCGIIGAEAVAATDTMAAWMGDNTFWMFDGTVKELPCDVLDYLKDDWNKQQISKVQAFANHAFSEIWWFYQSNDSTTGEPDSYVVYNHAKKIWYYGRLDRTVAHDSNPLLYAMMVTSDGYIYDHEIISADQGDYIPYITTGPLELDNGEALLGLAYVFPDSKLSGDVAMELSVIDMPGDAVRYSRTFQLDKIAPGVGVSTTGIMGRDIRMKLFSAKRNPGWAIGDFRVSPLKGATPKR